MAQEVRNIEQRTPPTTEHRDRIPSRPIFVPPSDIYETKDSIVVLAEMPGVAPDGVDITVERRVLTIRGRSAAMAARAKRSAIGPGDGGASGAPTTSCRWARQSWSRCRLCQIPLRKRASVRRVRRADGTAGEVWFGGTRLVPEAEAAA